MNTPALRNLPLSAASHPFDALGRRERDTLARIQSRTFAKMRAFASYAAGSRHALDEGYQRLLRGIECLDPCRCAGGAQDFACFVLSKQRRSADLFLDWMGQAAAPLGPPPSEREIDDLIVLLQGLDALLIMQAAADAAEFFALTAARMPRADFEGTLLARYRGRFFASRRREAHFARRLASLVTPAQLVRIETEIP